MVTGIPQLDYIINCGRYENIQTVSLGGNMSSRNNTYRKLNNKTSVITFKLKEMMFGCLDVIIFTALIIAKNLYYGKQIAEFYNWNDLIVPIAFSILPLIGILFLLKEEKRVKGAIHIRSCSKPCSLRRYSVLQVLQGHNLHWSSKEWSAFGRCGIMPSFAH
jgi:hypothetical protein